MHFPIQLKNAEAFLFSMRELFCDSSFGVALRPERKRAPCLSSKKILAEHDVFSLLSWLSGEVKQSREAGGKLLCEQGEA